MFQKILVAYDGSLSSETALSQGGEIARLCQGELHLFGVIVSTGGHGHRAGGGSGGYAGAGRQRYPQQSAGCRW